ncbi:MAG: DUF3617 domain-containing protein [Geminicoccaceae bacterium]
MKTRICRPPVLAPAMVVMALSSTAIAEGVPITPGLWEIKTHNSMLGTEEVEQKCMREETFDPSKILGQEEGCEINNEVISGNTVDYDLACVDAQAGGSATGHFSFTIDGDQGNGNVDMTFNVGSESMTMQYSMAAARLGDC